MYTYKYLTLWIIWNLPKSVNLWVVLFPLGEKMSVREHTDRESLKNQLCKTEALDCGRNQSLDSPEVRTTQELPLPQSPESSYRFVKSPWDLSGVLPPTHTHIFIAMYCGDKCMKDVQWKMQLKCLHMWWQTLKLIRYFVLCVCVCIVTSGICFCFGQNKA